MKRIEVMKRIMAGILVTATVLTGTLLRDLVRTQKYLLGEETTIDTDADYLEDGNYEEWRREGYGRHSASYRRL